MTLANCNNWPPLETFRVVRCSKERKYCCIFMESSVPVPPTPPVDVIIYRVRDQGLEVFLVNQPADEAAEWGMPMTSEATPARLDESRFIDLDPMPDAEGHTRRAIAIEADWHELPSLRALMYEDYRVAKEKAKQKLRGLIDLDAGAFFALKEAAKRMMPHQYAYLKELKEVITEKNSTKYL